MRSVESVGHNGAGTRAATHDDDAAADAAAADAAAADDARTTESQTPGENAQMQIKELRVIESFDRYTFAVVQGIENVEVQTFIEP